MGMSSGFGAGAGADMLQEVLQGLADRAFKAQSLQQAAQRTAQEQQRIAIEQQRATSDDAYRNEALKSLQDERQANASLRSQQSANALASVLTPGHVLDTQGASTLRAGNLGSLVQHQDSVLPSTAFQGGAQAGAQAPTLGTMRMTDNAGHGEQDVYQGTDAQQQQAGQLKALRMIAAKDPNSPLGQWIAVTGGKGAPPSELFKAPEHSPAYKEWQDAAANGYKGSFTQYQNEDANRKKSAPALVTVQTVDANGNAVTKIVPKEAGATYTKAAGDVLSNRLESAKAVQQTGQDIIAQLSDPAFKAAVGPVLGRAQTLRDFVGNPDPAFSKLAGQIESYALANMGVHGMRSAQGAQQIAHLLDQHHTPESLIAAIQGLNGFSQHFLENNGKTTAPAAGSGFKVVEIK